MPATKGVPKPPTICIDQLFISAGTRQKGFSINVNFRLLQNEAGPELQMSATFVEPHLPSTEAGEIADHVRQLLAAKFAAA